MSETTTSTQLRAEITVEAPIEKAFQVFTERFDTWWPRSHHIGAVEMAEAILEPREGGRWYERGVDGSECDWGRVLAWDPPNQVTFAWNINASWQYVPDRDLGCTIDVRFTADGPSRTTVGIVHAGLDGLGEGWPATRDIFAGPGGWNDTLAAFAKATIDD